MEKGRKNKMIGGDKKEVRNKQKYFYPDHQVTVEAESREEADKIVKSQYNK